MPNINLADILRSHAVERSEKPALLYEDRSWTYAELLAEAARVAQALLAEGVAPQQRVAVLDKNAPEYFCFLFGAAMTNAVTLAVNWRLAPPEMEYILNNAETRVLLVGEADSPARYSDLPVSNRAPSAPHLGQRRCLRSYCLNDRTSTEITSTMTDITRPNDATPVTSIRTRLVPPRTCESNNSRTSRVSMARAIPPENHTAVRIAPPRLLSADDCVFSVASDRRFPERLRIRFGFIGFGN